MTVDMPPQIPPAIVEFAQQNKLDINNMHYYCTWNEHEVYSYFNPASNGKATGLSPYILYSDNNIKLIMPKQDEYDKIRPYCNDINRQLKPLPQIQD